MKDAGRKPKDFHLLNRSKFLDEEMKDNIEFDDVIQSLIQEEFLNDIDKSTATTYEANCDARDSKEKDLFTTAKDTQKCRTYIGTLAIFFGHMTQMSTFNC